MPLLAITVLLRLVRRVRPMSLALAVYETWRRLPARQRKLLALAARRTGPRVASSIARRALARR